MNKLVKTCSLDENHLNYESDRGSDNGFNDSDGAGGDSNSAHSIEKIRIEPRQVLQKTFKSKNNWNKVAKLSKLTNVPINNNSIISTESSENKPEYKEKANYIYDKLLAPQRFLIGRSRSATTDLPNLEKDWE